MLKQKHILKITFILSDILQIRPLNFLKLLGFIKAIFFIVVITEYENILLQIYYKITCLNNFFS